MNADEAREMRATAAAQSTALARLEVTVKVIQDNMQTLVTRHEFAPVKLIAYGLATGALGAMLTSVLSLVVHKSPLPIP